MAHFAELDSNNVVLRVIVVNNAELLDENKKVLAYPFVKLYSEVRGSKLATTVIFVKILQGLVILMTVVKTLL